MLPREVAILLAYAVPLNLALFAVRRFIREHGGRVNWLNRSFGFAAERRYLQKLARSGDLVVARRAQGYLRLTVFLVFSFFPFAALMIWAIAAK